MKRAAVVCTVILLSIILVGFGQTAMNPDDVVGQWYSSVDQSGYLFREGLIYCTKHVVPLSDTDSISGAYIFSKNSVFLFAEGVEGLESAKELYLIQKGDGSFLCENKDGSGAVYFIRYHE